MAALQQGFADDGEERFSYPSLTEAPEIEDFKLIEEHIDTGLQAFLNEYEPDFKIDNLQPDVLSGRFHLDLNHPLAELDTGGGKAYRATDAQRQDTPLYAIVCDPHIPYRTHAVEALTGAPMRHMVSCIAYGTARISTEQASRLVMIFEYPSGVRMQEFFDKRQRFAEHDLMELILKPLSATLQGLNDKGTNHGRINPRDIFVDGNVVRLGECVSEPHGLTQDYLYEPVERLLTDPVAKGSATPRSDVYALGVLAVECLFGLEKFRALSQEEFIDLILDKGSYHAFVGDRDVPEQLSDFFRGIFIDNKAERWTLENVISWLAGRRYNLVLPASPRDATRPFEMHGREYYSIRALAHGIYRHWTSSINEINDAKLDRWLEMSAHKQELAEQVRRIMRSFSSSYSRNENTSNEMLMRLIITLDPSGPIRNKFISVNVDGMGMALAHYYYHNNLRDIDYLRQIIAADIPTVWADMTEFEKTAATRDLLYRIQRNKVYTRQQNMGFGLERMLYDFNPTLPCQCAWLLPYHVSDVDDTLKTMDTLSKRKAPETSLNDRHLAAFLASRTGISKEASFARLAKLPLLHSNPELHTLRLIQIAQDKKLRTRLPGLACWCAMRLEVLIDNIHSRKLRKRMKQQLKAAAKTGYIGKILAILVENEMTQQDHGGFRRASLVYHHNRLKMAGLSNRSSLEAVADDFGGRISAFIGYLILTITIFMLVDSYM